MGVYGPVDHEVSQECEVVGELLKAMNGEFARNGPNPPFRSLGGYHWFDGDGVVSRKRLSPSFRPRSPPPPPPLPPAAGVRHGIGRKTRARHHLDVRHDQMMTKFFRVDDS